MAPGGRVAGQRPELRSASEVERLQAEHRGVELLGAVGDPSVEAVEVQGACSFTTCAPLSFFASQTQNTAPSGSEKTCRAARRPSPLKGSVRICAGVVRLRGRLVGAVQPDVGVQTAIAARPPGSSRGVTRAAAGRPMKNLASSRPAGRPPPPAEEAAVELRRRLGVGLARVHQQGTPGMYPSRSASGPVSFHWLPCWFKLFGDEARSGSEISGNALVDDEAPAARSRKRMVNCFRRGDLRASKISLPGPTWVRARGPERAERASGPSRAERSVLTNRPRGTSGAGRGPCQDLRQGAMTRSRPSAASNL